jgi:hypothetical protein
MKDFNPDNEKHIEILNETEQAMNEEKAKQTSEELAEDRKRHDSILEQKIEESKDFPRLDDGHVDFMKIFWELFPTNMELAIYVQNMAKGYAYLQSLKTATKMMDLIEAGQTTIEIEHIIPEEILPPSKQDKVTSNDIN